MSDVGRVYFFNIDIICVSKDYFYMFNVLIKKWFRFYFLKYVVFIIFIFDGNKGVSFEFFKK